MCCSEDEQLQLLLQCPAFQPKFRQNQRCIGRRNFALSIEPFRGLQESDDFVAIDDVDVVGVFVDELVAHFVVVTVLDLLD